jgi:hypothetical protein
VIFLKNQQLKDHPQRILD